MESIVEHTYLWSSGHQSIYRTQPTQMAYIMHRCKVAKTFYAFFYLPVYDHDFLEKVAALHHTVPYSINLIQILYCPDLRIKQAFEHKIHTLFMVGHIVHNDFLLTVWQSYLDKSLVEPDTLHATLCQH